MISFDIMHDADALSNGMGEYWPNGATKRLFIDRIMVPWPFYIGPFHCFTRNASTVLHSHRNSNLLDRCSLCSSTQPPRYGSRKALSEDLYVDDYTHQYSSTCLFRTLL